MRWKIGSGHSTNAVTFPWIDDANFFVANTVANLASSNLRVADLFDPETRQWNVERLNHLFNGEDVDRILNTAIPPRGAEDKLVWHYSKDGKYTVKSAYKIASQIAFDPALEEAGDWRLVWIIRVPPKVKDFIWRVCKDCLPHKVNLQKKHVLEDVMCPLYGVDLENNWDIFFNCSYSWEVWRISDFENKLESSISLADGVKDLIMRMLAELNMQQAARFSMILWQLRKSRNSLVWEERKWTTTQTLYASAAYLLEWEQS